MQNAKCEFLHFAFCILHSASGRTGMLQSNPADIFMRSSDSRWMLEVEGFDPSLEPTIEAVLAMVNGYLGTRAALEEGSAVSRPATLIAGVFNTPDHPQTAELEAPIPELVVAPDWSHVR